MKPALWLLVLFVAAPSLPERKRVAEKLAARHGVVKVPASLEPDCFEYRAPPELGCAATAFLCPRGMASAMCTGSFSEQNGLVLYDHAPLDTDVDPMPELVLTSRAGDDCPECECTQDMGFSFGPGLTPAQLERARKRDEAEAQRLHGACVAEAAKKQRRELVTRTCQLLLVDPCRKEAFLRCTGRNGDLEAGDPPVGRTLHFSWAPTADGGVARGGEWQREE